MLGMSILILTYSACNTDECLEKTLEHYKIGSHI